MKSKAHRLTHVGTNYLYSTRSKACCISLPTTPRSTQTTHNSLGNSLRLRSSTTSKLIASPYIHTQQRCLTTFIKERPAAPPPQASDLRKTALHGLHVARGGKMVPFGGFSMPVQYADLGVRESHLWTREKASLFDVGHMYVIFIAHTLSVLEGADMPTHLGCNTTSMGLMLRPS